MITDFSNSCDLSKERPTTCLGCPIYAAPEMLSLKGKQMGKQVNFPADIYSAGITMMMLAGDQHPYQPNLVLSGMPVNERISLVYAHLCQLTFPLSIQKPKCTIPTEIINLYQSMACWNANSRPTCDHLITLLQNPSSNTQDPKQATTQLTGNARVTLLETELAIARERIETLESQLKEAKREKEVMEGVNEELHTQLEGIYKHRMKEPTPTASNVENIPPKVPKIEVNVVMFYSTKL